MDLGSELDGAPHNQKGLDHRSRSPCGDGKVRLQTGILAYTGQQLIPGPFYMSPVRTLNNCHRALHWNGPANLERNKLWKKQLN